MFTISLEDNRENYYSIKTRNKNISNSFLSSQTGAQTDFDVQFMLE